MKTAVFLYNPESGRGRASREAEQIDEIFRTNGYRVVPQPIDFSVNPFDGHETIDLMVVAGGDGTVNFAVNAMKSRGLDIPLGVIPAGTANDFAGALGMSNELLEAARQIAAGRIDRVDVGRVNDLWFVNIFSFGIFTTTSQRTPNSRKHLMGKLAYIIEGVKEFRTIHAVPLEIVADGEHFDLRSLMVLIFNGETAGGFRLARTSSIRDGLFDCILLEKKDLFRSTLAMGHYLLGGNPKIVRQIRARQIDIRSTINEPTDVDWADLIARHPDLCALAAERTAPEEKAGDDYWGFAETSERFALIPEDELDRLVRRAAAAVYGAEIAVTVRKDEREALRAKLGDDLLRYAVLRGRWQAGSLAGELKRFCAGLALPNAVERLSHLVAVLLWADWPEGLRDKTALRFTPHREAVGDPPEDAQLGRRVRAFLLKLIKSEGDEACRNLFK